MRTPKLLAIELFDQELPELKKAASALRTHSPHEGWVRSIRKSLGMSMRALAHRMSFKVPASVNDLERNELSGAITLETLRRAAEALDSELVYAIIPRKSLGEVIAARARDVARRGISPISKSMALEGQGLTKAHIERQIDELAHELKRKPGALWR